MHQLVTRTLPLPSVARARWTSGASTCPSAPWRWPSMESPRRSAEPQSRGGELVKDWIKQRSWNKQRGAHPPRSQARFHWVPPCFTDSARPKSSPILGDSTRHQNIFTGANPEIDFQDFYLINLHRDLRSSCFFGNVLAEPYICIYIYNYIMVHSAHSFA